MEKWFHCPVCNKKLLKYTDKAISQGVLLKCKKCKNIVEIKIKKIT